MIRRILVALDGSSRAPAVVAAAVEMGTRFGATLIPFRAFSVPPEFPPAAHVAPSDPLPAHMERVALAEMLALIADVEGDWEKPIFGHGQPSRAILEAAEANDVDLIVLGSHGWGRWDLVLGTTAGRVANLAHRSVLIVHDRLGPSTGITVGTP